jgi:tripartite-type tricarboxylate transporter receptor subunit TctC
MPFREGGMRDHAKPWLLALSVIALINSAGRAQAQPVEDFYRGKQVRIIVSFDVGNDYDQWARLLARHLGRHVPGNPTFVVQNMPAAGGIASANFLYNTAPKDGSVIGMIGRNLPYHALVQEGGVQYDPVKFNWLGSPEVTNRVCVAADRAPVKKAEDLYERELLVGGSGAGSAISTTPVLLARLLGMKFKLIEGYSGPAAVVLAMDRGEVDGICQTVTSLANYRPGSIEAGKWRILFNIERMPMTAYKAPSVFDYIKSEDERRIVALYSSSIELGRPMVAPPGTPAERVSALRNALTVTLADPALLAEAQKQKLDITLVSGDQLSALVNDLMTTPPAIVKRMQDLLKP